MFFARKCRFVAVAALLSVLLVPSATYPQAPHLAGSFATALLKPERGPASCPKEEAVSPLSHRILPIEDACEVLPPGAVPIVFCPRRGDTGAACTKDDERVEAQLRVMGKRGDTIAEIRLQALEILQSSNACSAWFREVDADPAATFRSLDFFLDEAGPQYILSVKDVGGAVRLKQPYVASAYENAGRNARIRLNANGAFFNRTTEIFELYPGRGPMQRRGLHSLSVASYSGSTAAAQITTMLHELGHIVGRIPEDSDSWDGLSARNTAEVLHKCRPEIDSLTRKGLR